MKDRILIIDTDDCKLNREEVRFSSDKYNGEVKFKYTQICGREMSTSLERLNRLVQVVDIVKDMNNIDGIIVLMDFRAVAYVSNVLAYIFPQNKPIVLVDVTLKNEKINNRFMLNFDGAVHFIKHRENGVYVVTDVNNEAVIYHGNYILDNAYGDDKVHSLHDKEKCRFRDNFNRYMLQTQGQMGNGITTSKIYELNGELLYIKSIYGNALPTLKGLEKAVLIDGWRNATFYMADNFDTFIKDCMNVNLPIYICSNKVITDMKTIHRYRHRGIEILENTTSISQYVKLWLLIVNELPIEENMMRTLANEFII